MTLSATDRSATQTALLAWFASHQRPLPWRSPPGAPLADPYGVLVSELMLQQTRVDTVLGYYDRWLARWPTVADLAAADVSEVLAQWTGLGYYNRARNLHAAAQAVVAHHGGRLPADPVALAALPGLGPYTVGAVASIAFGLPVPLVDGNVARVLARWHAIDQEPSQGSGRAQVWAEAALWLLDGPARAEPGTWNQALMELGATVCTPRQPRCPTCPVAATCLAFQLGRQRELPLRKLLKAPVPVQAAYALVQRDGPDGRQVLLGLRPTPGRWAGLWEPPGIEGPQASKRVQAWLQGQGIAAAEAGLPLVHVLTHRRYEALPLRARWLQPLGTEGDPPDLTALGYTGQRWLAVAAAQSRTGGLSRLAQRLVATLDEDLPLFTRS